MGVVGDKVNINCLASIIQQVERMNMTPCSEFFLPLTKQSSVILIATYSHNMYIYVYVYKGDYYYYVVKRFGVLTPISYNFLPMPAPVKILVFEEYKAFFMPSYMASFPKIHLNTPLKAKEVKICFLRFDLFFLKGRPR